MASNTQAFRRIILSVYLTIIALGVLLFLAFGPALAATRYGYTWSLLIWLVPNLAMLWWFLASKEYRIHHKRAFYWATFCLFMNGAILDFFFAHGVSFESRRAFCELARVQFYARHDVVDQHHLRSHIGSGRAMVGLSTRTHARNFYLRLARFADGGGDAVVRRGVHDRARV